MTKLLALTLFVALLAAGTDAAGASLRSTINGAAAGAPTVCSTYVAVVGVYGCGGGNPLPDTSSDGKTLEACAKYAAIFKAGMFSYNPPDQHCIPFTAEQCRTKGRINLHAWCGTSTCTTTYTLYDLEAAPAANAVVCPPAAAPLTIDAASWVDPATRTVKPLTICDGTNTYQTAAPALASDRVCTAHPICAAHQVVAMVGDSTTSRTCRNKCNAAQYFSGSCKAVQTCSGDNVQSALPTATTDRVCEKRSKVVYEWTYHGGAQDPNSGDYLGTMVNQLGATISVRFYLTYGVWVVNAASGLHGRVSFLNLPSRINQLQLAGNGNDIKEIVSIQGPYKEVGSEKFYVQTYFSGYGSNPNLVIKCPKGTIQKFHEEPGVWGFRGGPHPVHGGDPKKRIQCTYP